MQKMSSFWLQFFGTRFRRISKSHHMIMRSRNWMNIETKWQSKHIYSPNKPNSVNIVCLPERWKLLTALISLWATTICLVALIRTTGLDHSASTIVSQWEMLKHGWDHKQHRHTRIYSFSRQFVTQHWFFMLPRLPLWLQGLVQLGIEWVLKSSLH